MNPPTITETTSGWDFTWEEGIQITVTRVKIHSDDRITGEVQASTSLPGYDSHLYRTQFNFNAARSRSELAKLLSARCKDINWSIALEQLCHHLLERARAGDPLEEIWTGENVQPPRFMLEPIVVENYSNIIYGDRGTAKSTIACAIASILKLPWTDNPLDLTAPTDSLSVLYLDWETDRATVLWQLTRIQRGGDLPQFPIHYRRCRLPLAEDIEQIQAMIDKCSARLIIIDSLGPACGGELEKPAPALAFFAALSKLKVTSLILAHNAKNSDKHNKTVFGSSYFENLARNIWEISKVQEAGEEILDLGLFHRKPPPFGQFRKPLGFKLYFEEDKIEITPQDPKNVAEFIDRMGTRQRILAHLKTGSYLPKEIADALKISMGSARQNLLAMKRMGTVEQIGLKYGLPVKDMVYQER